MFYNKNIQVDVLSEQTVWVEQSEKKLVKGKRNAKVERALIETVAALHPTFKPDTAQSYFYMSYDEFLKHYWFLKALDQLKAQDIEVFGIKDLKNLKYYPGTPKIDMAFRSTQDWFETDVKVAFGDNKVTIGQLRKAVKNNENYVKLSDGSLGIIPEEWMEKFGQVFRSANVDKDGIHIHKTQFNTLEDLVDPDANPEIIKEILEKKERLRTFTEITQVQAPKQLKADLRSYQQEGLNWLGFLGEYGWGGILADDMGLGKTLQALSLICLELEKNPKLPNIVVAPTTLLFNWKNEIEKFAPHIEYIIYHGARDAEELTGKQLILTSYGLVPKDINILKKTRYNLIIADESQAIKNPASQRHKALTTLKGRVRIAMSGTPIENNLNELFAQMNFVNPGFFSGLASFKDNYVKPIEGQSDPSIVEELRSKTKPFILRRTKEQVLTELPEKTEEYIYCEMDTAQRKVYDAYRNKYRDYILGKFAEEGVEKSQMYVLEGLTRLRQVCDSPLLIEKDEITEASSSKLKELTRHVTEKTGNHKILVFSQFVKMLELVREEFDKLDINYEYLDGKTSVKEREKRVDNFQNNDDCRVFLISLKAGGTGLNLTSADYVYILDPWWNPASENQAIDRCYRMGQSKKVFAYRMICKDTVEEKIMEMQQSKKKLSDDVVGSNEGTSKKLDESDIRALFE